MKHKCAIAPNGCKSSCTCKCKRGFEDTIICFTHFDDKGFPVYERLREEDFFIVPHNKEMLLDWGGHCNVEFSGGALCVLYLYKYLFKGSKKTSMSLRNDAPQESADEIALYLKGRFLCAMDAMWR